MLVIIVGAGVVGIQVASRLVEEGKDVAIIDHDGAVIRYVSTRLDCISIHGPGNNIEILRKAGAQNADYFIALTGSDEINMICCTLVESEFKIPNKLARVRNEQYLESYKAGQHYWGIDYLINPTIEAVKQIVQQVDTGAQNYVMRFEEINIQIQRFPVRSDFPFLKRSISELSAPLPNSFIVPVIQRNANFIIPDGSTVILEGDDLYISAKESDYKSIYRILGGAAQPPKSILLVGAGSIGALVLEHLFRDSETGVFGRFKKFARRKSFRSVRVIERDYDKCRAISERFPDALVINADISEEDIFEEEGLNECDMLITATETTEFNIITSLYALASGLNSAITLVRSDNYSRIAQELGLSITVSLKNTVVNSIIRYLLRGNVTSIQSQGVFDFLEVQVGEDSQIIGKQISDIAFPLDTFVMYIKHDDQIYIPNGSSTITLGDHLLIIAKTDHIAQIEKLITSTVPE